MRSDFHESVQGGSTGISDIYFQSKDITDFLNLPGKLEPPTTLNLKFVLLSLERSIKVHYECLLPD